MKTLSLAVLAIMTLGLVIGVSLVTSPQLQQRTTEAAVPPELTEVANQDVTIEFTSLAPHNRWDYMLTGGLCFTNNPPLNGKWKVSVYHDGLLQPEIPIGASVQKTVSNPATARCKDGNPMLLFNAPINMPAATRLPEGAECLPAGDLDIRVDTAGPPWQLQAEVGKISRSYFCPDDPQPTNNPNQSPTPAQPGDITVNLQLAGTWKSNFTEFQATAMTCDFTEQGDINWESCGAQGNKTSNTDITRKGTGTTINKTVNLTINDTPGGAKALVLFYDYKRDDGKADNTGVRIEPINNTNCSPSYVDFGAFVCGINLGASGKTTTFKLQLPTANVTTYELRLGKEDGEARSLLDPCTHAIDTNNKQGSDSEGNRGQCSSSAAGNNIKVTYHNNGTTEEKLYWLLGRCNGTFDENDKICEVNAPVDTPELVQNFFEVENAITLPAGQVIVCTFDKSKYPTTENEANVRSSGAVSCENAAPTATPIWSPTPTTIPPTPSLTPRATATPNPRFSPTPTPDTSNAGFYTSISFYNGSSKAVTSITTITCYGPGKTQCTSELVNTSIQPRQRGTVETNLVLPQGINDYSVKCRATFEGSSTPVNCPNEVTTPLRQNVIYRIVASEAGSITGQGVTEIDACDVNKDSCCNANDFSVVATKYAEEIGPTDQNSSDINGDGIINGFDLVFTQANFGKGEGCRLNLAPELNPELRREQ
jgi:hypothetical protein